MALDKIEIANYALIMIGNSDSFCISFDGIQQKKEEKVIGKIIDKVINDCLIDILPNFAIKEYKTIRDIQGKLKIPPDCLKVLSINKNLNWTEAWKIQANEIILLSSFKHTSNNSVLINYISNSRNVLENSNDNFNKYCAYSLGVEIALAIKGDMNIRNFIASEKEHFRNVFLTRENIDNETTIIY